MARLAYVPLLFAFAIATSSCGLLTDDKRSLKLVVQKYQNHLTAGEYDEATAMCDAENFLWIKDTGKDEDDKKSRKASRRRKKEPEDLKGEAAAKAFHKSIQSLKGSDKVMIDIGTITELQPGVFSVIGFMQVRQIESGALRSTKWKMTMKWIKTGEGWKMKELKERGPRESFRS